MAKANASGNGTITFGNTVDGNSADALTTGTGTITLNGGTITTSGAQVKTVSKSASKGRKDNKKKSGSSTRTSRSK